MRVPMSWLRAHVDLPELSVYDLADRAARTMRLLPAMLGADGERRYLFMFQNNAEIRSTGFQRSSSSTYSAERS